MLVQVAHNDALGLAAAHGLQHVQQARPLGSLKLAGQSLVPDQPDQPVAVRFAPCPDLLFLVGQAVAVPDLAPGAHPEVSDDSHALSL